MASLNLSGPLTVVRLALADFLFYRWMSAVNILSLSAVLTPLLLIYGLKTGFIDHTMNNLLASPTIRELIPIGARDYESDWLDKLAEHRDVEFLVPSTRSLAATIEIKEKANPNGPIVNVDLVPSALDDPITTAADCPPVTPKSIALTEDAARKLDLSTGDAVTGTIQRRRDQVYEAERIELVVGCIISRGLYPKRALFVPLDLAVDIEDYRDGIAVSERGWEGAEPSGSRLSFASFRMYAESLEAVATLQAELADAGVEVRTQAPRISVALKTRANLNVVFSIVVAFAALGYGLSLSATSVDLMLRKREHLNVLEGLGVKRTETALFPLAQAWAIALLGSVTAALAAEAASQGINLWFQALGSRDELVCVLGVRDYALAIAFTMALATVAGVVPGSTNRLASLRT